MRLRQLTGAIIVHEDEMLLQKRPDDSRLFPGFWTTAGGHMEDGEHNDPQMTCLREIREETGFTEDDISDMHLKYVTMRRKGDEIRVMYVYVLHMKSQKEPWVTEEGAFYWKHHEEIVELKCSFVIQQMLCHYINEGYHNKTIMHGTVQIINAQPHIRWIPIDQWDGMQ